MTNQISAAAEAARENARTAGGQFGEQHHPDAGQLGFLPADPVDPREFYIEQLEHLDRTEHVLLAELSKARREQDYHTLRLLADDVRRRYPDTDTFTVFPSTDSAGPDRYDDHETCRVMVDGRLDDQQVDVTRHGEFTFEDVDTMPVPDTGRFGSTETRLAVARDLYRDWEQTRSGLEFAGHIHDVQRRHPDVALIQIRRVDQAPDGYEGPVPAWEPVRGLNHDGVAVVDNLDQEFLPYDLDRDPHTFTPIIDDPQHRNNESMLIDVAALNRWADNQPTWEAR